VPAAVSPWKVTEHDPVAERGQVGELKEPPVVPAARVKVAVPVGMFAALVVSVTVAVQEDVCPGLIELGLHEMLVEVASFAGPLIVTE
jgi:hypothetical protein